MTDMEGLETTLWTSLSVALETLETMVAEVPPEVGGARLGYMKGITSAARAEVNAFLEDRDHGRIEKVQSLMQEANAYFLKM